MDPITELHKIWGSLSTAQQDEILTTKPAGLPPDGVQPNFKNPPTRNDVGAGITTIFLLMVIITGLLRLYSRIVILRVFRLEDYLGFASYVPYIALTVIFIIVMQTQGFIIDQWNVSLKGISIWMKYTVGFRICYSSVMILAKSAILFEWSHLFVPRAKRNWFFWAIVVMLVVNLIAYGATFVLIGVSCPAFWKTDLPWEVKSCLTGQKMTGIVTSVVNLILDVVMLLLPQPVIWRLNMTRRRKIGVSMIFSIGLFVVAFAAGRVHATITPAYHNNATRGGGVNALWAYGEVTFVLMVFAAPGTPRAFANQTFLSNAMAKFRSWTRIGDGGRAIGGGYSRANDNASPWPPTIGGSGDGKRREVITTELDLMETRNTDMDTVRSELDYAHQEDVTFHQGILKATITETKNGTVSAMSTEATSAEQCPWMSNRTYGQ